MKKIIFFSLLMLSASPAWAQGVYTSPSGNPAMAFPNRYRLNNAYPYGYPYPVTPPNDPNTVRVGQPYYNYGYPVGPGYDSNINTNNVPNDGGTPWDYGN